MRRRVQATLGSIGIGLVMASLLVTLRGVSPVAAGTSLLQGAFGDVDALGTTLLRATPLILTGLSVCVAYRGGVFNVGAEGQLIAGAWACVAVGSRCGSLGSPWAPALTLIAGAFGGAAWALVPAVLKRRGQSEVLTTLMCNHIAAQFLGYSLRREAGPGLVGWLGLKAPDQPFPRSVELPEAARLPVLWDEAQAGVATGVAVITAAVLWWILWRTRSGLELRATGSSREAARAAGVRVERVETGALLISGALAGLAGTLEVAGVQHRLVDDFLVGAGFEGIPAALLGGLDPAGTLVAAFFLGALRAGQSAMQIATSLPVSLIWILQALTVLVVLATTSPPRASRGPGAGPRFQDPPVDREALSQRPEEELKPSVGRTSGRDSTARGRSP